ncbi:MAG: hypothetical protein KAQ62_23630, partial [Cyclobacteriaceae bacterium]|nr:hypothetical protein [Cyclobacteriaceae bacterium]
MKRRNFFGSLSWSMAGLGLATSCSNSKENDIPQHTKSADNQLPDRLPAYREKIKATFPKGSVLGSNDRVTLALIGAGGWGTNLILNVVSLNKNVIVKYVCDVDDT